jgi:phosphatidylglycerophosphate synthase
VLALDSTRLLKFRQAMSYEPTSRRPIADVFRATAHGAVRICVRAGISADTISYWSMLAAAAAALCFWRSGDHPWLLVIAPLFCYVRLWFNMLDGMVALAAGSASARGELLNDLPDRISDVIIFAGVAHSGWMRPALGYWAAICAVLTAYVGLFGQAIRVQRQFGGLMAKPWRMVVLHVAAWATLATQTSVRAMSGFSIFDWSCLLVIAGCIETMIVRIRRILTALDGKAN